MGFPFVTAKPPRLEGAAFRAGSTYPNQMTYTPLLFRERGGWETKNGARDSVFLVELKLFWF